MDMNRLLETAGIFTAQLTNQGCHCTWDTGLPRADTDTHVAFLLLGHTSRFPPLSTPPYRLHRRGLAGHSAQHLARSPSPGSPPWSSRSCKNQTKPSCLTDDLTGVWTSAPQTPFLLRTEEWPPASGLRFVRRVPCLGVRSWCFEGNPRHALV